MKTILFFIFAVLFFACKDDVVPEPQTRLIRKIEKPSVTSDFVKAIWEYHYDKYQRIDRITIGDWNEQKYIYNNDNQLVIKKTFHDGILNDSTTYKYSNGKLIEEMTYYPLNQTYQVNYEYDSSNLIRKTELRNENDIWVTNYDYSNGLCFKETLGNGIVDFSFTVHYYFEGKLKFSEMYQINPHFSTNKLLQQINYTYNENGDLILEESIQVELELVKNLNYAFVYEYEVYYE